MGRYVKKKKPQQPPKPQRLRRSPLQVYLSEDEREDLRIIAQRNGVTASELVRRWIVRTTAGMRRYDRVKRGPEDDPRQMTVSELLE